MGIFRGPLPFKCGHKHLGMIGRKPSWKWGKRTFGQFKTHKFGEYPGPLCKVIAEIVADTLAKGPESSGSERDKELLGPSFSRTMLGSEPLGERSIYIGRGSQKHGLPPSVLGNPWKIHKDGDRPQVIDQFRKHLEGNCNCTGSCRFNEGRVKAMVQGLSKLGEGGWNLVCHCGPGQACHGDAIIEFLEAEAKVKKVNPWIPPAGALMAVASPPPGNPAPTTRSNDITRCARDACFNLVLDHRRPAPPTSTSTVPAVSLLKTLPAGTSSFDAVAAARARMALAHPTMAEEAVEVAPPAKRSKPPHG